MPYFSCCFSVNSGTGGSPNPENRNPLDTNNDDSGERERPATDPKQPPPPGVVEGDRGDNPSTEDAGDNNDEQKNPGPSETNNNCSPGFGSSEASQGIRFGFQHDGPLLPTGSISSHNDGLSSPPADATVTFPVPQADPATPQASSIRSKELPANILNINDPLTSLPAVPPLTFHPQRSGYSSMLETTNRFFSSPAQNQRFSFGTNGATKPEPIPFRFGYQAPAVLATVRDGVNLRFLASNSDLVSPGTNSLNAAASSTAEGNAHATPGTRDTVVVHVLNSTTGGTKRAPPSDTSDDADNTAKRSKSNDQEPPQNSSAASQQDSLLGDSNTTTTSPDGGHDAIYLSDENMFTLPPLPLLNDTLRAKGECRILNLKIGHRVHGEVEFFGYHRLPPGDISTLVKFQKGECEIAVREVQECDLHVGARVLTLKGITRQDVMQRCGVTRDRDISQVEFAMLLDAISVQLNLIFSQYNEETETFILLKNPAEP